jgi:hypothetical protein
MGRGQTVQITFLLALGGKTSRVGREITQLTKGLISPYVAYVWGLVGYPQFPPAGPLRQFPK